MRCNPLSLENTIPDSTINNPRALSKSTIQAKPPINKNNATHTRHKYPSGKARGQDEFAW